MSLKIFLTAPLLFSLKQVSASIISLGTDDTPIVDVGIDLGNNGSDQGWNDYTFETGVGTGAENTEEETQDTPQEIVQNQTPTQPPTVPPTSNTPRINHNNWWIKQSNPNSLYNKKPYQYVPTNPQTTQPSVPTPTPTPTPTPAPSNNNSNNNQQKDRSKSRDNNKSSNRNERESSSDGKSKSKNGNSNSKSGSNNSKKGNQGRNLQKESRE